jgi:hypothetical protein
VTTRGAFASGAALVVVYLVALVGTVALRDAHVRPLYDGFAPPPAYSWVDPPAFWASGNVEPKAAASVIALGPGGSAAAGIATPDGQFAIDVGRGAIARHGEDRDIAVAITPVDPKHLASVPLHLRANGNAYRVTMTYEPSRTAVAAIAKPGSLLIEIPELGNHLFRSAGGQVWSPLAAQAVPPRELSLSAAFTGPGYYLAATNLPELVGPPGRSAHRAIELGIVAAALAAGVLLAGFFVRRRLRKSLRRGH